jgi:hypothetical protein
LFVVVVVVDVVVERVIAHSDARAYRSYSVSCRWRRRPSTFHCAFTYALCALRAAPPCLLSHTVQCVRMLAQIAAGSEGTVFVNAAPLALEALEFSELLKETRRAAPGYWGR